MLSNSMDCFFGFFGLIHFLFRIKRVFCFLLNLKNERLLELHEGYLVFVEECFSYDIDLMEFMQDIDAIKFLNGSLPPQLID
jgi:hypothetical protein